MPYTPDKVGEVIVPLSPSAISGLDPAGIADAVAPTIIDVARKAGGHPIGAPELLRETELRARTDDPDLLARIDAHPDRLWLVCRMIPLRQADEIRAGLETGTGNLEIVAPPVHLPRGRRGRG